MKRPTKLTFAALFTALAILFTSCGAPPSNQNTSTNQNVSSNSNRTANTTNANDSVKSASLCSEAIDKTIVQQIRLFIQEDPRLRNQRRHINFYSVDCVVYLNGYTETWADFQKLHSKINATDNVKKVDLSNFDGPRTAGKIAAIQECDLSVSKPCGELCIPKNAICEILEKSEPQASPAPSETPK